eukprot:COSAG02_NODE_628_length_19343_cov_15.829297_1_plen_617_part_00
MHGGGGGGGGGGSWTRMRCVTRGALFTVVVALYLCGLFQIFSSERQKRSVIVNSTWLPNDPDIEKVIEAMPSIIIGTKHTRTRRKNIHRHGAWELLKKRIRHNDRTWGKMNVTFPSQMPKEPVRILLLASPYVMYGMDWHTGEHLQWGDIIYALVRLGHKVDVPGKYNWKVWNNEHSQWDLILTDYGGVSEMWRAKALAEETHSRKTGKYEEQLASIRCKLRVLDTFGTSAEFNKVGRNGTKKMPPALGIRLDQYWGYYPQVGPRSTFIGFTITNHKFGSTATSSAPQRKWKAVLWGKHPSYMGLTRNREWLHAISKYIDIVATIDREALESGDFAGTLPDFIDNRGILDPFEYFDLLRSSALLIGVGQPFWGNAPLDALDSGAMTLLTTFHPPLGNCEQCVHHFAGQDELSDEAKPMKNRFENTPNSFPLSSQNPYIESLGEPDVYTVPLDAHRRDASQLRATLARARAHFERLSATGQPFPSRLPQIWEPQAFVNRLSRTVQLNGLCGGVHDTGINVLKCFYHLSSDTKFCYGGRLPKRLQSGSVTACLLERPRGLQLGTTTCSKSKLQLQQPPYSNLSRRLQVGVLSNRKVEHVSNSTLLPHTSDIIILCVAS